MSRGTAEALGSEIAVHHRTNIIEPGTYYVGSWIVLAFALEHDAAEPLGFLIGHSEDRLLFIPDTAYVENRFDGVNIIAIECNHVEDILSENIVNGKIDQSVGRRVRRNHMSLQTVKDMLLANDRSKLREVHLLHLSDLNSDEERMKREIQELLGVPVYIA